MALAGFCFSAYLTYLELFVIDAICQWCVTSAVLMTVLPGLTRPEPSATQGEWPRTQMQLILEWRRTVSDKRERERSREERVRGETEAQDRNAASA